MLQVLEESNSLTLSINQGTLLSQGVVLKRRRFQHAILSGSRSVRRMGGNDEMENPEANKLPLMNKVGLIVKPMSSSSEEQTSYTDTQPLVRPPRKYRMRDQYGYLLPKKHMESTSASAPWFSTSHTKGCSKLTLNARSLKLGTVNMLFRGSVTFSVDYIEIANKVQIEALELTGCEWCRGHSLPALFLHMTDATHWRLRAQLAASMDTWIQGDCQGNNRQEIYLLIILERVPTVLEEAMLEEIFSTIGKLKNLSSFLVTLTCKEATDRLMARKLSQKELSPVPFSPIDVQSDVLTLSVSDNEEEDDDDLMECSPSQTRPAKTLVMYPPPPAKGGFSITKDDLSCLNKGEFLNDVIMDFYLKYLVCEKLEEEDANRWHVFSSFFYKSLTKNDLKENPDSTGLSIQERRHNQVKTWTRHMDLFNKDFIFVPINQSAHWYLAVICFPGQASHYSFMDSCENKTEENVAVFTPSSPFSNPMSLFYRHETSEQVSRWSTCKGETDEGFCFVSDDDLDDKLQYNGTSSDAFKISDTTSNHRPCILIMDSLSCSAKPTVVKVLQDYLEMEWRVRKGSLRSFGNRAMKGWSVHVPQQDNHTDCGVYVLQYVESFITNPPRAFHPAMDLRDWFTQRLVKKKRERIKQLLFRLHHQQEAELGE